MAMTTDWPTIQINARKPICLSLN